MNLTGHQMEPRKSSEVLQAASLGSFLWTHRGMSTVSYQLSFSHRIALLIPTWPINKAFLCLHHDSVWQGW